MEKMINAYAWIQSQLKSEKGQGMVEYALILVFIVGIAVYLTGSSGLGEGIQNAVNKTTEQLNSSNQ